MVDVLVIKKQAPPIPLTDNERYIIETLRNLSPFEKIEIMADQKGRPNYFIVTRTKKVLLTDENPIFV